jgi:uncharacterized protein (DUF924 family)
MTTSPTEVLKFWFEEIDQKKWWIKDTNFDDLLRLRFSSLLQKASQGELSSWRNTPEGRLAEIIVLDQFSRNIHRNTPSAFSQDPMSLVLAQEAVAADAHIGMNSSQRCFLFLPYMHSESAEIHETAEALYKEFASEGNYEFELKHKRIIDRFGRYPHRNAILGRESTAEEIEFLEQPGSGF